MSDGAISKNYEKLFRASGIEGCRLGPHTLRHTCASNFVEDGGAVEQMLNRLGELERRLS